MRFGTVALVGRSNVGKSTFLNAALGERLAIVSPQPQTTRDPLLGVVNLPDAQIAFLDTPGLHRPQTELGRRMNLAALDAARAADLMLFITDDRAVRAPKKSLRPGESSPLLPEDEALLRLLPGELPAILAINKVDLVRQKDRLLPLLEGFHEQRPWQALVPVSLQDAEDVARLLREVASALPEGEAGYDPDTITNQPVVFFVREYVREQVLLAAGREVPHAVAVSVDQVEETTNSLRAKVTLHVEKVGQRKILVGTAGQQIKAIGSAARQRIAELIGKQVHLELFVRVTPRWKEIPRQLAELGYEGGELPRAQAEAALQQLSRITSGPDRAPPKGGSRDRS